MGYSTFPTINPTEYKRLLRERADPRPTPVGALKGIATDLAALLEQPSADLHEADEAVLRDMLRRAEAALATQGS